DDRASVHLLMAARYGEPRTANPALAKKSFLAAHKLLPQSLEALQGLEAIYVKEGDVPRLVEILEKSAEACKDDAQSVRILLRLAEIYEKQFLKPDQAVEKLELAFALDPNE